MQADRPFPGRWEPGLIWQNGDYAIATMAVELRRCPTCQHWMLDLDKDHYRSLHGDPFPGGELQLEQQIKRAKWRLKSYTQVDGVYICQVCRDAGKATFICAICEQRYPTSDSQWSAGDPPSHLCKTCYETVTAKVWNDKRDELREKHRWDFD